MTRASPLAGHGILAGLRYPAIRAKRSIVRALAMHLFVYGTLRRGADHPMHALLHASATLIGPARVRGVLYRVGHYPGLVLDPEAGWVRGDLYRLRERGVLARLDDYEGIGPHEPPPHEYRRILHAVHTDDAREHAAWIYEYAWPTDGRPRIASGDFLAPPPGPRGTPP